MKEWIETQLYSKAAEYYITDADPIILCGPEARRTDTLARNTGIIGPRGATYVEMYRSTYNSICEQLSDKIERNNIRVNHSHTSSLTTSSRFIDMDMTGNSHKEAGRDFRAMLKRQKEEYSYVYKAITFTFSLRYRGLDNTFKDISTITESELKTNYYTYGRSYSDVSDEQYTAWKNEYRHAYCYTLGVNYKRYRIKDSLCYSYNTGGGPMLTGIIIYT